MLQISLAQLRRVLVQFLRVSVLLGRLLGLEQLIPLEQKHLTRERLLLVFQQQVLGHSEKTKSELNSKDTI